MSDFIIGSDEVGYGAWAGPLYVCAVLASKKWTGPAGLTDSKALTPTQRVHIYNQLVGLPLALATVSSELIDMYGVKRALLSAHGEAIKVLLAQCPTAEVVVDGVLQPYGVPQARCIPKADATFPVVSAASIVAKVNRDHVMSQYHQTYPYYGFDTGAGYGTKEHARGIAAHGLCPLHRTSYRPIREYLETHKK